MQTQSYLGLVQILSGLFITPLLWPHQTVVHDEATYDFIIVGAGTAGCVLANRLTELEDVQVLLIEAGGDPPATSSLPSLFPTLPNTQFDWELTSTKDGFIGRYHRNSTINMTSGKMLGGSSSLHHMVYSRGDPTDYETWASITKDNSWNYENTLTYFKKSERLLDQEILRSSYSSYHGTEGPMTLTRQIRPESRPYFEAFRELGNDIVLDTNGRSSLGYNNPLFMIGDGQRQSSAYNFLAPIRYRSNLHVLTNTLATEIVFDDNNTATGVRILTHDRRKLVLKASKEVIISAGALKSPQLLMLSGIGPKSDLESLNIKVKSDLPVGKNFQDHVLVLIAHRTEAFNHFATDPNMADIPVPIIVGYATVNETQKYPDYQIMSLVFPQNSMVVKYFCRQVFDLVESVCEKFDHANVGRDLFFTLHNMLQPISKGEIKLRSTNPEDDPLINPKYFSESVDLENEAVYLKHFNQVINTTYFRRNNAEMVDLKFPECRNMDQDSIEFWRCYALNLGGSIFHYTSTCAMGSVVDSKLKVLGIHNLRVVDASVLPNVPRGNPNAPVMMVAEKVADMIKKEYF